MSFTEDELKPGYDFFNFDLNPPMTTYRTANQIVRAFNILSLIVDKPMKPKDIARKLGIASLHILDLPCTAGKFCSEHGDGKTK
jgi:hypothetical protein